MAMISILLYLILFVAPVIIILVLVPTYIDSISAQMVHMQSISISRTLMYQIIAFGLQTFFERVGMFQPPNGTELNVELTFFSSAIETNKQLSFFCKEMTKIMQDIDDFRKYNKNNTNIEHFKELIFQGNLNYTYFSKETPTIKMISLTNDFSDKTLAPDFVNTSSILNPSTSITKMADNANKALIMINHNKT